MKPYDIQRCKNYKKYILDIDKAINILNRNNDVSLNRLINELNNIKNKYIIKLHNINQFKTVTDINKIHSITYNTITHEAKIRAEYDDGTTQEFEVQLDNFFYIFEDDNDDNRQR